MRHLFWFCLLTLLEGNLIRRALRYADIPLVKAALWMDMDVRQLDRELKGEGHLKLTALEKLPLVFHQWLALLRAEQYGLPSEVRCGIPLVRVLRRRRMAKAELGSVENTERVS